MEILDIDRTWHMHQISDGERRRVQIMMGLIHPFEVLLLDEVCQIFTRFHASECDVHYLPSIIHCLKSISISDTKLLRDH